MWAVPNKDQKVAVIFRIDLQVTQRGLQKKNLVRVFASKREVHEEQCHVMVNVIYQKNVEIRNMMRRHVTVIFFVQVATSPY